MKLHQRVEVTERCSFKGQRGHVTQVTPFIMVLIDDEAKPMRFGELELMPIEESPHIGGAE